MAHKGLAALILAAGYSSRMQEFKPLLPMGSARVIERVISLYRENQVPHILVVAGHRAGELAPVAKVAGALVVRNPAFELGMFSSVKAGAAGLPAGVEAFFSHPVDVPLVRPRTVSNLIALHRAQPNRLIYPCFGGRRGHPPLIPASLLPVIERTEVSGNLRQVLEANQDLALEAEMSDPAILWDMDTPKDYQRLARLAERGHIPTTLEAEAVLQAAQGPGNALIAHGRAVARAAGILGRALVEAGCNLDLELISAAAWLHDLAKGQRDHAAVGQRMLTHMGFALVGEVVGEHTDLDCSGNGPVSEAEVIFLADKLVRGDGLINLAERYAKASQRFGQDPEVGRIIAGRRQRAFNVRDKLAEALGRGPEELLRHAWDRE